MRTVPPTRVLVAAPRAATRAACLSALAGRAGVRVAAARTAAEAFARVRRHRPHVVVLAFPDSRARRVLVEALSATGRVRLLVVGSPRPTAAVVDLLARGVHGHLAPADVAPWLAPAVVALARGQAWCPRRLVPALIARLAHAGPTDSVPSSNGRAARRGGP